MRLIVGLGNPGRDYARNRHNIGFMAVDEIVRRHGFEPFRAKFQGQLSEGRVPGIGDKVLALKPETYMNESGRSVLAAMSFYKLDPADILVLHDEIDLAPGKVRVKRGGGHAGHNGLRSLHSHIGDAYGRLRIGVGHPGDKDRVAGHVLKDFSKADQAWVEPLVDALAANIDLLLAGDDSLFMTRIADAVPKPEPKESAAADKPAPEDT